MRRLSLLATLLALAVSAATCASAAPVGEDVELRSADGTRLTATFYPAAARGPGVLLFHQSNRTRRSWSALARRLAGAGLHLLAVDERPTDSRGGAPDNATGYGESTRKQRKDQDLEAALVYLGSRSNVEGGVIGAAGAGVAGVDEAVELARLHREMKSLVLLSGETSMTNMRFLMHAPQLPGLFVTADQDEYPPTVEAMELLYLSSAKRLVHYVAAQEAPWLWYEPFDIGRVPPAGAHGTDLFATHPELPGIILAWFQTTLLRTPGHAPADTIASAAALALLHSSAGIAEVRRELSERRGDDPQAQLFPELTASIIAQDHLRDHEPAQAVELFELIRDAYPDSADASESLAEAYLANGQIEQARQEAHKALAMLAVPHQAASSWTDTAQYRGEIRKGAQQVLDKAGAGPQ